jgi:hypothetical protein
MKMKYGKPKTTRQVSDDYQGTTFWEATWKDQTTVIVFEYTKGSGAGVTGVNYISRAKVDEEQKSDDETSKKYAKERKQSEQKSLNGL